MTSTVAAAPLPHSQAALGDTMLNRLWSSRWLLGQWMRRDYVVRYRQSILGVAWAVVQPIFLLAFYGIIFRGVLHVKTPGVPYILFAFCGIAPWTFISTAVSLGINSVLTAQAIVTKVWFPREVIPLAAVGVSVIDLGISTLIMLGLALVLGHGLGITILGLIPVFLGLLAVTAGVVTVGAALTVFLRDLRYAVPLILQVVFIATPVMYAIPKTSSGLVTLVKISPITCVISGVRSCVAYDRWPTAIDMLYPLGVGVALLAVALLYFRAVERRFPDVL